jgi:hypothetical protein
MKFEKMSGKKYHGLSSRTTGELRYSGYLGELGVWFVEIESRERDVTRVGSTLPERVIDRSM